MDAQLWATYWTMSDYESERLMLDKGYYMTEDYFWGERTGIFNPVVKNVYRISNHDLRSPFSNFCKGVYWHDYALPKYGIAFHFAVLIPKEDISKYSNFTVQHKTKK